MADLVSSQVLQKTLDELRNITRIDLCVTNTDGVLLVTTFPETAIDAESIRSFVLSAADSQIVQEYHYFKVYDNQNVEYILISKGSSDDAYMIGKVAVCEIQNLIIAYKERLDKNNFIQNLLLDNLLLVDVYNRAKKLRIDTDVRRVVYMVETKLEKDISAQETVKSLFASRPRDFITAVDEKSIIIVKELKDTDTFEDMNQTARMLVDMLNAEAMSQVRVSYGNPVNEIKSVSRSYKEAKMALEVGKIFYADKNVVPYNNLGIGRLIYQLSPTASGMGILSGSLSGGQVTEVYLGGYRLATDEEGSAFSRQICEAMKASLGTYGIQQLSQKLRGEQETVKRQEDGQSGYEEEEVLKQYEESKQPEEGTEKTEGEGESGNGTPSEPDQKQPVPEDFVNPIEVIQKVMKMGILGLVLPEGQALSQGETDVSFLASKRELQSGFGMAECGKELSFVDKILSSEYILWKFPCYTSKEKKEGLQCQVEYVLCGKNSDQDNLAGTVNRLLALREAANLVYLAKDAQKQGEMEAMAGVIAASFGVPAAMPVVKMALAVCWAFAESILDLRELLDGGKVALFKTAESWQLSLEQLPKLLETGDQSRKNAPGGMEYSDYLRLLLMQKSGKAVTFGAMDLVEYNMRTEQQQPGFRLDCCVDELEAGFTAVIGKREYEITRNYGYEMQGAA